MCATCPVQQECLAYALATGQHYGVWGGRDEQGRRLLRLGTAPSRRPAAGRRARVILGKTPDGS